jgi:uncharacterized protein YbaP (TraB family)
MLNRMASPRSRRRVHASPAFARALRPQQSWLVRLLCVCLWSVACATPQTDLRAAPSHRAPSTERTEARGRPTPVATPATATPEQALSHSTPGLFLYAVKGPRGTSHLLGTMHVGFGFEEVLTADARARFRGASRVMLEADVSAADANLTREHAILPAGQSLRTMLGEPSWTLLVARLGPQIPPPFMERLKPWLPAVTLGLMDLEGALRELKPDSAGHMMDVEVMGVARADKKELLFLETVAEQLAMFDQVPIDEQIDELRRSLSERSSTQGKHMLRAFAEGDEAALTASLFEPEQVAQAPGFFEVVLHRRNQRWLPVLEREISRGGAFIAVGAAHLLGERGLLAALRQRGYAVSRVGAP